MFAALVVVGVVLAVLLQTVAKLLLQRSHIFGLGIPINVERLDLCAQKMIRTARSELGKTGRVVRVHIAQDFLVVLDCPDEALLL